MLCGWRILSEVPLTGVPTSLNNQGNIDVVIDIATGQPPVVKTAGRFVFQHSTECSLIKIQDVADFEIRDGRQIRIWPAVSATQKDIEIFLLGPAWATLCHQRGTLPLHASAIVTGTGVTAFVGRSGAGKSMTAGLLNSFGYELIADDILPVSFDRNSIPGAWPYLRRLKLHRDPIIQLALTPGERVSETLDKDKYFVHSKTAGDNKWRRLERVFLLENQQTHSSTPIEQITGADAVHALVDQTYHFKFVVDTQRFGHHLNFCTRLASKIPIYRLHRSPLTDTGERLHFLIRTHAAGKTNTSAEAALDSE
jgi:hypothetical protein